VNWSALLVALAPSGLLTWTSNVPNWPLGAVATIVVVLTMLKVDAVLAGPKETAVASMKFVPVMVTTVPPVVGPEFGVTPVTVGGEAT